MGHPVFRPSRSGISFPEVIGVIACLGIGLFAGCWMFIKDSTQLADNFSPHATSPTGNAAIKPSALSNQEAELQAIRKKMIQELHAEQARFGSKDAYDVPLKPENHPIDHQDVRDLLGEGTPARPSKEESLAAEKEDNPAGQAAGPTGAQTLAYWNAMNNVMAEEEAMRSVPAGGLTKENAADYIVRRGKAGNYAARKLRGLDRAGVDPAVVALGGDIASWYERGTQLNGQASYLLNQASDATRQGQTGKKWGETEKTHNARVEEINRRGDAVRGEMSQKYGLEFPDLR